MKRNYSVILILLAGLVSFSSTNAMSSVTVGKSLFGRGRVRLSAYGGAASALNETYALVGLGAGYYLLNGLEAGVDGEAWLGATPNFYKVTPQLRYVFYKAERIIPYIGAFYRRTYYESLDDLNSYGGRVGIFTPMGGR